MNRIYLALKILTVCLLVVVILLLYTSWGRRRPIDYRIEDVYAERIMLSDSICHGHQHYVIHFVVSPAHYEYGFWIGGAKPYTNGSVDSILDVSIESGGTKQLEEHILNVEPMCGNTQERLCLSVDSLHVTVPSHSTIQRVKNILQTGADMEHNHYYNFPQDYFISLDSLSPMPQYVIVKFLDREIRRKVKMAECQIVSQTIKD